MIRAAFLAALLGTSGCQGLGRSVVGTRPIVDASYEDSCEVTPACVPSRSLPSSAFVVEPARLAPEDFVDCDLDGLADSIDSCPGVPDAEGEQACDAARVACERLAAGVIDLEGADLRGCRLDAPIEAAPGLTLAHADLSCARLTLVSSAPTEPRVMDATGASLHRTALVFDAPAGSWIIDVSRGDLRGTFVRLSGGARLRARESVFSDARIVIEPGGSGLAGAAPALEVVLADIEATTIVEAHSAWPGRVRIERSRVRDSRFAAQVLELVETEVLTSSLGAAELFAMGGTLRRSAVRAEYAVLSAIHLRDVIFAACVDLQVTSSVLEDVDVAPCEAERFRVVDTEIIGSRIGGGLALVASELGSSIVGSGPSSVLRTEESRLEAVTICDLGAAAFYGGELRCVRCDADAFMGGSRVCVAGSQLYERGCPAIELAPSCP